jgi:thiamine-monophosphate kinase
MPSLTSENIIIQLLRDRYAVKNPLVKKGIGDDAAVIHPAHSREYLLITTDMLLEGIDFRCDWTTPRRLGSKSIAVNLSDLAAMGARPQFFTVSLAVPGRISERWILDLYEGMTKTGSSYGVQLIGGDLSHSNSGIMISITVLGESLNRKVLYRSGGRAGDLLYVTGILGRSAAGLRLLEDGCAKSLSKSKRDALHAHHLPVPRCETGLWLAQCGMVHCMMDLSDGLSVDLPRMCAASGIGAEIYSTALPVFGESKLWGCNPIELALHGGEDFELLFAVPASKSFLFEKTYPPRFPKAAKIGKLTRDPGSVWMIEPDKKRRRLSERGYDHFSSRLQQRRKQ